MLPIETFLAFCLAAFLLSISPGPSNLYIMARSIHQGFVSGAAAACGMATGSFIYVLLSALGLAAIFTLAPLAYTLLKIVGAIYLVYLGISYLRAKPMSSEESKTIDKRSLWSIFNQSIIVELTNPKTALFFVAFLPQFVSPEYGNMTLQFILLGSAYALIALCCDLFVAGLSGKLGNLLKRNPKVLYYQDRISGSLLVSLGTWLGANEALR